MEYKKNFITTETIYNAINKKQKVLVRPGDIITPLAKELAKNRNIKIIYTPLENHRIPVIAANWKMNKPLDISEYCDKLNKISSETDECDILVFPPSIYFSKIAELLDTDKIGIGLQNIYYKESGAFTGEISSEMMKEFNGKYVLIGHSERRTIFSEDNDIIYNKLMYSIEKELLPILCIGEDLETNKSGKTIEFITSQIISALHKFNKEQLSNIIIAYEPIWAIGTGLTAKPEQIESTHNSIRQVLKQLFLDEADKVRILYGGSVKPENAKEIMCCSEVDGCLVGGASLDIDKFQKIIEALF